MGEIKMKKDLTEIIFILDKSGSMTSVLDETIIGFNNFLEDQKKVPGEAKLTLKLFSTYNQEEIVYDGKSVHDCNELSILTYHPDGFTALLDAIGNSIKEVGKRLNETKEEEKPEKVIMVILTDGQENDSRKFTSNQIRSMIEHQTSKYSWEFVYLGANQDAFANSAIMGISSKSTLNYDPSKYGTLHAHQNISNYVSSYRTSNNPTF
jgi:Mg-chelatase subunit ChlD